MKYATKVFLFTFVFICLAIPTKASAKFSGLMFGDYYWYQSHNTAGLDQQHGFVVRRIYGKWDQEVNDAWSFRLNFEMSLGDPASAKGTAMPAVKDAFVKWKQSDRHSHYIGLSGTPTFDVYEKHLGYRPVEKSPLDLWGFGSSRDLGWKTVGKIGDEMAYTFMFGNGNSNSNEKDKAKKAYLAFDYKTDQIWAQVEFESAIGASSSASLVQLYLGYTSESFLIGGMFALAFPDEDKLMSFQAKYILMESLDVLVRYDHLFQTNGNDNAWVHPSKVGIPKMVIAGVDWAAAENVHLIPNVQAFIYDAGVSADIIPRMTFFWKF